jgi:hypothetical protein
MRAKNGFVVETEQIEFANGNRAMMVLPAAGTPLSASLAALDLPSPRALLVLNGGTARLEPPLQGQLAAALADGVAQVVAAEGITVITGGTDAGIFQLFGQGLARWGRTAPCIGVAVASRVVRPGHPDGDAALEPNHSHFVLTAGETWGDETATMYSLVEALGRSCPSLAVFAGGGEIAIHEMEMNVAQARPMLLLAGSGRATDGVLAARAGEAVEDARLRAIAQAGKIDACSIADPVQIAERIHRLLFSDACYDC